MQCFPFLAFSLLFVPHGVSELLFLLYVAQNFIFSIFKMGGRLSVDVET